MLDDPTTLASILNNPAVAHDSDARAAISEIGRTAVIIAVAPLIELIDRETPQFPHRVSMLCGSAVQHLVKLIRLIILESGRADMEELLVAGVRGSMRDTDGPINADGTPWRHPAMQAH